MVRGPSDEGGERRVESNNPVRFVAHEARVLSRLRVLRVLKAAAIHGRRRIVQDLRSVELTPAMTASS